MRTFRLFVLRRLRQAPLRAATTVLTIAAGVALAVSIIVLLASIDRSFERFGQGLAGPAPLRITGATFRGGLPEDAVNAAAAVEGVAEVVPMIQLSGRIQDEPAGPLEPALVLGVDCRIEALVGPIGCNPAALAALTGPMALGPRHEGGTEALLRTDLDPLPLSPSPVLPQLAGIGDGRVVVLPLALAQDRFTRPAQVDVAYVLPEPGTDLEVVAAEVQRAVGAHLPVSSATESPAGSDTVLGAALPIYSLLGIFALGIGGVLVANTAAMSLEARRRELAVLGALGGRARTVIVATVSEMALLGAAGGVLGTFGGMVVARPIVASLSTFTEEVVGARLTTHVPLSAFVTGIALGALLGGGSAFWPARRATRLDVAGELSGRGAGDSSRPARLGRRVVRWSALALLGAAGCWAAQRDGGLEPWQAALVVPSFIAATIGALFATAAAAPLLLGQLRGLTRRTASAPLRLAVASGRRDHRRTGLLAVAIGAAVATAFVTEGSSAAARASIEASFRDIGTGLDVATAPTRDRAGPGIPPDLLGALAQVPGVGEVQQGRFVLAGGSEAWIAVQAVNANPLHLDVIDGEASAERLAAGEVLIGAGLARQQGIRAGDQVRVVTPSGPVDLPVQGVWEDGNNVGANITISPERLEELFGPQPPSFISLRPEPGVSEVELAANVRNADLHPELHVRSFGVLADDLADEVDTQFASFRVMQQALLAVVFVAVLSSLLLAGVQRRQELGLLAAVGADPPGLARLLLVEAGLVAITGIALSAAVGPLMLFCLSQVLPFVIGFRNPVTFDWSVLATAGAVALVVVLLGAAWPARRAARVEVLDALRYE